jgi:deazaflavin-dependent oxidoreductase (nitroreductase family)
MTDTNATSDTADDATGTAWDPESWENALIADVREHDGRPSSGPLAGHPILLLYTTGAKSGERRRSILTYSRDGDAYIVAGSAGGAPKVPAWVVNVKANPDVTIEIGKQTFEASATIPDDAEQERLWAQHVAALPWFADYPAQAGRRIPVVRVEVKQA